MVVTDRRRWFCGGGVAAVAVWACLAAVAGGCANGVFRCKIDDVGGLALEAREVLIDYTTSPTPVLRVHAIEALGQVARVSSVRYILKGLRDEYWGVRFAACMALMELGHQGASPLLEQRLEDTDISVRVAAAGALHSFGQKRHFDIFGQALNSEEPMVRRNACMVIGRMGDRDEGALKVLRQLYLREDDMAVKLLVAEAMALLGDKKMLRMMANYARSGYDDEQIVGLLAIGEVGGDQWLDQVAYVYQQSRGSRRLGMRLVAGRALAMMGDDRGFGAAVRALSHKSGSSSESAQIRALAAMAVGQMSRPEALCKLRGLLEDLEDEVRVAAAGAILKITE